VKITVDTVLKAATGVGAGRGGDDVTAQIVCPRCGARDSFIKGYLPDTCLCRVCQSQLDWREIPGCGPDCEAAFEASPRGEGRDEGDVSDHPGE
jgi:rubredoxin